MTGLEAEGVVASKPTHFAIFTAGAGKGKPEVVVLDPNGRKDTVPAKISPGEDDTFRRAFLHAFFAQLFRQFVNILKETVPRDFLLQFPSVSYTNRAVSNFFENSRRYSQLKVHHRCRWHRWQMEKIFNQKNYHYFFGTPLGIRVSI
jgi:hypothetical protein